MPTSAQSIIRRVAEQLQDKDSIRWTVDKLVRDLNDGQRELVAKRPDAATQTLAVTLVAGARQTLPVSAVQLIDIARNTASKKGLRKVDMALMDAADPDWQAKTGKLDATQFMYDLREPRTFYVSPPALVTSSLDLVCPVYPVDIAEPATGLTYAAVTGNLSVADQWGNALHDWVLYRAWSMDAEFAGNAQLAAGYLALFKTAIGEQAQAASAVVPKE
jgi:hypothetical protein